ncbi:hypothetical protein SPF06_01280 [Sinomonas sp. JGH33]|uniref:Uncharacterized protein n=1 Tax=Sinomonas terricola TaxID=3110330 RepID=A0ABU5T1D2_9MICC|nr:hypothetical protein [Sinomonas sp. JGH33]MEA5453342.1 hypothetical protein [Sinomonas sp. JGH33]
MNRQFAAAEAADAAGAGLGVELGVELDEPLDAAAPDPAGTVLELRESVR